MFDEINGRTVACIWFRTPVTWKPWIRLPGPGAGPSGARRQNRQAAEFPLIMHGDAAYAGQGVWAETLNMSYLRGYTVGGTVHIIVNNLIGFTANPSEAYSTRFASDMSKRLPIPIFHVNAEDPDAVVRVARLAVEYRYQFASDVVIDLIGYRRHGHSEVDDPTITQPFVYRKIKDHPPLYEIYASRIGAGCLAAGRAGAEHCRKAKKQAQQMKKKPLLYKLPSYWAATREVSTRPP